MRWMYSWGFGGGSCSGGRFPVIEKIFIKSHT